MDALLVKTPADWAAFAVQDIDAFLIDHASCERKASAVGMMFVVRYPDRPQILGPLIQFAREELLHFHQVYKIMESRGLQLGPDEENPYVNIMMKEVRVGRDERLLDRLLLTSLIEARGCERFGMVAEALTDEKLKNFYARLARAEQHHHTLFYDLALVYFSPEVVAARYAQLREIEAKAVASLPYRHAVH